MSRDELGPISEPLPREVARAFAEGTAATDDEVGALLARVRTPRRRASPVVLPALVLAVAAAVLLLLRPETPVREVVRTVEVVREVPAETEPLMAGVFAEVLGEVVVVEDGEVAVLELVEGAVGLDARRTIAVMAGPYEVRSEGSKLRLQRVDDRVELRVLEGRASLSGAGESVSLGAGERWVSAAIAAGVPVPRPKPVSAPPPVPKPEVVSEPEALPEARDAASHLAGLLDLIAGEAPSEALLASLAVLEESWPAAAETQEAIVRVAEVRAARLPAGEAVRMLASVRAEHPGLPRRLDLLELQARIAKDGLRDCGMALPAYRELAGAATGVQRAQAQAWRGICAQHQGLTTEAVQALESAAAGPLSPELRAVVVQTLERIALLEDESL